MRSHPYTPPAPLPPIIAAILPASPSRDIPLDELHPETSRLIPARKKRHHVRVQGRLALVRSVSTADLGSASAPPRDSRFESAVGSVVSPRRSRRHSLDGRRHMSNSDSSSETEDDEKETVLRDRQLRGYGIGGFGNIRIVPLPPSHLARCSEYRMLTRTI